MELILFIQVILFISGTLWGKFLDLPPLFAIILSGSFLVIAYYFSQKNKTTYSKFISLGVMFCFLGDISQKNIIPGRPISSAIFFSFAHISFITGYIKTIYREHVKIVNNTSFALLILYYSLYIVIWYLIFQQSNFITINIFENQINRTLVILGSLVYGFLVSTMAFIGLFLFMSNKAYIKTAIGSLMFLISDSTLAIFTIYPLPFLNIIIWLTYLTALWGIIYGNNNINSPLTHK